MSPRPIHALLGAVTLAALAITTGPPAGAGDKAPPCPAEPKVIVSNLENVVGTPCNDVIHPGPDVHEINALGGDDVVRIKGPAGSWSAVNVLLGEGHDQLIMQRPVDIYVDGQGGRDTLRADSVTAGGIMNGGRDEDRLIASSPHVSLWGWTGDDRIDVSAASIPGQEYFQPAQFISPGDGDDVVTTVAARGPRERWVYESLGDDTYFLRQPQTAGGRDTLVWYPSSGPVEGGFDIAMVDPSDAMTPALFGKIESFGVAWG